MKKLIQCKPLAIVTFTSTAILLSSCSGFSSPFKLPEHKIDYKNSKSVKSLEVPPDLTAPEFDSTYSVSSGGTVSAVAYSRNDGRSAAGAKVLPMVQGLKIKRAGSVVWLEAQASADALWPKLTNFWTSLGVALKRNEPRVGVMETEWAENRAGLPMDWIRKALGKVFQDSYDAGTRDKFKLRVERPSATTTNIFISHTRAEEMLASGGGVKWEMRPADSGLEAEILNRLSAFLQGDGSAATPLEEASQTTTAVSWSTVQGVPVLNVAEVRKRAWLRAGFMLERIGMSTEGQDRNDGVYKVIYRGGESRKVKRGWFSKVFKGSKDALLVGGEYQIHMSESGGNTMLVVTDGEGQPVNEKVAREILGRLKVEFER